MDIRKSWLVSKAIAHRGFHNAEMPENSVPAFENAVKNNFAIELDVRLIDDGTVVVFHDDSLTRMTSADGYACNLKLGELENTKLLGTEYSIPTFERVLEAVNGKAPILIETKNVGKIGKLEAKVIDMLSAYGGDIAVQSFNPYSLELFQKIAPLYLRGQLSTFFAKSELSFFKRYMLKRLKFNSFSKPDFISYCAEYLPNHFVTKTGLPVLAWTIRSNAEMEKALPACDNIIFERFKPQFTGKTKS
jgi:glycerophosphoryl diester phosphodiesterase